MQGQACKPVFLLQVAAEALVPATLRTTPVAEQLRRRPSHSQMSCKRPTLVWKTRRPRRRGTRSVTGGTSAEWCLVNKAWGSGMMIAEDPTRLDWLSSQVRNGNPRSRLVGPGPTTPVP